MDEPQQPPATPSANDEHGHSGAISRGKTLALWVGVAALLLALLGSLMIVLKSLQADRTLAQISKSAAGVVAEPPEQLPPALPPAAVPALAPQAAAPHATPAPASRPPPRPAGPVRRAQAVPPAKPVGHETKPKKRLSVERRLAQCKELAGEAAAACFRRACNSYAYHAPICVNDRRQ